MFWLMHPVVLNLNFDQAYSIIGYCWSQLKKRKLIFLSPYWSVNNNLIGHDVSAYL